MWITSGNYGLKGKWNSYGHVLWIKLRYSLNILRIVRGIDMLNKTERMMMEQMLADLETLKERNSDSVDCIQYRTESSTEKIRRHAFSDGSIDGRIRLLKQLLQVLA